MPQTKSDDVASEESKVLSIDDEGWLPPRPPLMRVVANGAGWGGPARGTLSDACPSDEWQKKFGKSALEIWRNLTPVEREYARRTNAEKTVVLEARLWGVANDGEHAHQMMAAISLHQMINGKPTVRQEITGRDGAPLPAPVVYIPDNGRGGPADEE